MFPAVLRTVGAVATSVARQSAAATGRTAIRAGGAIGRRAAASAGRSSLVREARRRSAARDFERVRNGMDAARSAQFRNEDFRQELARGAIVGSARGVGNGLMRSAAYATGASFLGRGFAALGDIAMLQRPRWTNGADPSRIRLNDEGLVREEKKKKGLFSLFHRDTGDKLSASKFMPLKDYQKGDRQSLVSAFRKVLDVRLVADSEGVKQITEAQAGTTEAVNESSENISTAVRGRVSELLQGEDGKFKAGNAGGKSKAVKDAKAEDEAGLLGEINSNQKQLIAKEDQHSKKLNEKVAIIQENTDPLQYKAGDDLSRMLAVTNNRLAEQGNEYLLKSIGVLNLIAKLLGYQEKEEARRLKAILGMGVATAGIHYGQKGIEKAGEVKDNIMQSWENFKADRDAEINNIKEATAEAIDDTKIVLDNTKKGFADWLVSAEESGGVLQKISDDLASGTNGFIDMLFNGQDDLRLFFKDIVDMFKSLWDMTERLTKSVIQIVISLWKVAAPILKMLMKFIQGVVNVIVNVVDAAASAIGMFADVITGFVKWFRNSWVGKMLGIEEKGTTKKLDIAKEREERLKAEAKAGMPLTGASDKIQEKQLDVQQKTLAEMQASRKDAQQRDLKAREIARKEAEQTKDKDAKVQRINEESKEELIAINRNTKKEKEQDDDFLTEMLRGLLTDEQLAQFGYIKPEDIKDMEGAVSDDVIAQMREGTKLSLLDSMKQDSEDRGELVTLGDVISNQQAVLDNRMAIIEHMRAHPELYGEYVDDKVTGGKKFVAFESKKNLMDTMNVKTDGHGGDREKQMLLVKKNDRYHLNNDNAYGINEFESYDDYLETIAYRMGGDLEKVRAEGNKHLDAINANYGKQRDFGFLDSPEVNMDVIRADAILKRSNFIDGIAEASNKKLPELNRIARAKQERINKEAEEKAIQDLKDSSKEYEEKLKAQAAEASNKAMQISQGIYQSTQQAIQPHLTVAREKGAEIIQKAKPVAQTAITTASEYSHKAKEEIKENVIDPISDVVKPALTGTADKLQNAMNLKKQSEMEYEKNNQATQAISIGDIIMNAAQQQQQQQQQAPAAIQPQNAMPNTDESVHLLSNIPLAIAQSRTGAGMV